MKNAQNVLKFDQIAISNMLISSLMSEMIFIKYLPPVRPKLVQNKNAQNLLEFSLYWYFEYNDFYFKVKKKCCEIFVVCLAQISSKNKNTQNLLKIGLLNISNMPISILNSKKKKIRYLPPATPKLVSKLKIIKNLLKFSTLDISNILISILMSKIIFIKYFYQISVFIKFQ